MVTFKGLKLALVSLALFVLIGPQGGAAQSLRITLSSSIDLERWTGVGDKAGATDVCVYNSAGSSYTITASDGGSFELTAGAQSIPYSVGFSDTGPTGTYTNLPHGSARSFSGADQSSQTCGGGYNGSVKVTVTEGALGSARPGSYSTSVTLTLSAGT